MPRELEAASTSDAQQTKPSPDVHVCDGPRPEGLHMEVHMGGGADEGCRYITLIHEVHTHTSKFCTNPTPVMSQLPV